MKIRLKLQIVVLIVIVSVLSTPAALYANANFKDLSSSNWAYTAIQEMVKEKVFSGYSDNTIRPNETITRGELAAVLVKAAKLDGAVGLPTFDDVSPKDWYYDYVERAMMYLSAREVNGEIRYEPKKPATREEITVALARIKDLTPSEDITDQVRAKITDFDTISEDAQPFVAVAIKKSLISGYPDLSFRPKAYVTRAETAYLVWKAFFNGKVTSDPSPGTGSTDSAYSKLTSEKDKVSYLKQQFMKKYGYSSAEMEDPLLTELNGDTSKELVVYNSTFDADEEGDLSVYSMKSGKELGTIKTTFGRGTTVKVIGNPLYKKLLVVLDEYKDTQVTLFSLTNDKLVKRGEFGGDTVSIKDYDGDGYSEFKVSIMDDSYSSSLADAVAQYYIYKWNGKEYVRSERDINKFAGYWITEGTDELQIKVYFNEDDRSGTMYFLSEDGEMGYEFNVTAKSASTLDIQFEDKSKASMKWVDKKHTSLKLDGMTYRMEKP